jgi:hypothetical protein
LIDVERRQPALRWSAIFAGAACSVGFWMLLQFIGLGIGLAAVDVGNLNSLRGVGIGTTVWSLVSPLIAMFFGGMVAGRLAQTFDRKAAGMHGLVMWAFTSILGLCAMISIVAMVAAGTARVGGVAIDETGRSVAWVGDMNERTPTLRKLGLDAASLLAPINQQLSNQDKPRIAAAQLEAAMRGVIHSGIARGDFNQELLVDQLVANTALSRADAIEVERQIEALVDPSNPRGYNVERRAERYVLEEVDASGKALITVGLSLVLSLLTSVIGAMLALHRRSRRSGEGGSNRAARNTDPGYATSPEQVTTPMTGPASPVIPPTDIR